MCVLLLLSLIILAHGVSLPPLPFQCHMAMPEVGYMSTTTTPYTVYQKPISANVTLSVPTFTDALNGDATTWILRVAEGFPDMMDLVPTGRFKPSLEPFFGANPFPNLDSLFAVNRSESFDVAFELLDVSQASGKGLVVLSFSNIENPVKCLGVKCFIETCVPTLWPCLDPRAWWNVTWDNK